MAAALTVLQMALGALAALGLAALPAAATPAQGYVVAFTPLAHHGQQALLVRAVERSDPNTASATAVLPSMLKERAWWLVFDTRGRQTCSTAARSADPAATAPNAASGAALLAGVRHSCPALPLAGWRWLDGNPAATARWSARQVCVGERCLSAAAVQRSLHGARSQPAAGASAAPARCVAGRWLLVSNGQAEAGSGAIEGARFNGLPPALRSDIVGYESVRIDGIAALPAALDCP